MSQRPKGWGYEVEKLAERALRVIWPEIARTGASNQKVRGAPDLAEPGGTALNSILLVVTKDKGRHNPMLVTLSMEDLITISALGTKGFTPVVQVKGRETTWIGGLHRELREVVEGR